MTGTLEFLETDQFRKARAQWLIAIARKENIAISFVPKTDRVIRFEQLLADKNFMHTILKGTSTYAFQYLDFGSPAIEDRKDLEAKISDQFNRSELANQTMIFSKWIDYFRKNNITLILIVLEAEQLLNPAGKSTLSTLSYFSDEFFPTIRTITIFEADITHPNTVSYLPPSTRLYQNISRYPLYTPEDTLRFIKLLERQWDIRVSTKEQERIVTYCGGHFWLVKEAIRTLTSAPSWSPEDDGMSFRLRTLFNLFSPSEQSVLTKITRSVTDLTSQEQESLSYLTSMRVIEKNHITIKMLHNFLLGREAKLESFVVEGGKILLNHVPVNSFFSRQEERVMKLLITHSGEVVSRDLIATAIWPTNTQENYSDWAIDQLMRRLRKRIADLSLSPKRLSVVRGKGYLFSL